MNETRTRQGRQTGWTVPHHGVLATCGTVWSSFGGDTHRAARQGLANEPCRNLAAPCRTVPQTPPLVTHLTERQNAKS